MTIEYRKGNIFDTEIKVIGHGCNTVGVMGAGIALQMANRYPEMVREYQQLCFLKRFKPGRAFLWTVPESDKKILNLGTQYLPGANAKTEWIYESLTSAIRHFSLTEIALPKIGAGIGGLSWKQVQETLEKVDSQYPFVRIVVYEL